MYLIFSGVWPYANPNKRLKEKQIDFNANMTIDDTQFEVAKTIIKDFDVILILEEWDLTSAQLKCQGIYNTTLPHSNVGQAKSKHSRFKLENFPLLHEELIKYNKYDIELYNFAKQLAIERAQACERQLAMN